MYQKENNNLKSSNNSSSSQQVGKDTSSPSSQNANQSSQQESNKNTFQTPTINLPKGGGAIQGIGEKFQANPVTGTGSMTVPIAMSPGRGGFSPQLALSYDSGAGNSPFGLGWNIGLLSISRKTSKGLPEYDGLPKYYDADESDVFLLSGAEDLVPLIDKTTNKNYVREEYDGNGILEYKVYRYRPRIEGLFARIEKWLNVSDQSIYWKSITKENITTIYGQSDHAKIKDANDDLKVFQWKIEKTFDDKGNVIEYQYKKEDGSGFSSKPIFEKNRDATNAYNQSYLKRVLYGNTAPFDGTSFSGTNEWLFELVLDYGEHDQANSDIPDYAGTNNWKIRQDIFSSFRSGFEIRTYRLCRRVLMYHHFSELNHQNYLVKSTEFSFDENSIATQIDSITHSGYRWDGSVYSKKSYPPVEFKYTQQKIDEKIYSIQSADLPNAPQGIDGQNYQFNDLYGEGLNGILSQKEGAWYYKRNEGNGKFGAQELVAEIPSLAVNANVQIADFGGNGLTDVLVQNEMHNGFYELNEEHEWSNFKSFTQPVNFNLNDPSLRMLDLDGNGIPDILITENDCYVWYASDAKEGYKTARRVAKALDEEQGPRIVFNESFQTIFLSDMSGDGLTDIVRIRNGEICYWANMGYGNFSAKITMANAPHFDYPDYFDPARIRLADIDGSGSTDILYLGRDEIQYWLNQSSNSWSASQSITNFPKTSNLHSVSVFDLLGNGTSCIVWSTPLAMEANAPMKYIKLMGDNIKEGNKPYLLKEVNNNMGAITKMKYEASTKFYLEDRQQGKPWITKLPFPVQVLVRQEVFDEISKNHFVSRHAYHHGYFDKTEREFRGFGMVEQWDTEDYESLSVNTLFEALGQNWIQDEITDIPPIHTKTWFHTGFYQLGGKITKQYEKEYYQGIDPTIWKLEDTEIPIGLNTHEIREAARALKGRALRVEVYGLDDSPNKKHPYTVAETKYHIKTIQNKNNNRHASFYICECESLSFQYERNPADPRIAHQTTLEIDDFGNVLKSASIVYGRQPDPNVSHPAEQTTQYVTYSETDFINKPNETNFYRIGVPSEQRTFEITGLALTTPFKKEDLKNAIALASPIDFETEPTSGNKEKRLIQFSKTSFYDATLSPNVDVYGDIAFHALPYQTYEAVYTDGLMDKFQKKNNQGTVQATFATTTDLQNLKFVKIGDHWFRKSGKAIFDASNFYLPIEQHDPYGHVYKMTYDNYHLAMIGTETDYYGLTRKEIAQATSLTVLHTIKSSAILNYRTLQPSNLTDPNENQTEVIFDELGMVIATAIKGKTISTNPNIYEGDKLDNYTLVNPPSQNTKQAIYNNPHTYLQNATSFFYYDLFAFKTGKDNNVVDPQPNYALSIVREKHQDSNSPTQINFSYSDGFGQTIMVKVQAEPGDAYDVNTGMDSYADPRWVGNGRTVFNNKGNPVKQYEPFFSHSFEYETEAELVQFGVSPILHYDVLGRNIRTDLPDGTFTKVEFIPWKQITFDQNDTILEPNNAWYAQKSSGNNYEQRAATLTTTHADTPKVEHLDTLGRVFLMQDDNGTDGIYDTRFKLDILGNQIEVEDAKGRLITKNHFNMSNEPIFTESMDAGRRWVLTNIMGNPISQWNDRDFKTRIEYDDLQRSYRTFIDDGTGEKLVYLMVYGERMGNPSSTNHFGQVYALYDQAGGKIIEQIDFKGNPISISQSVCQDYKNIVDWKTIGLHLPRSAAGIQVRAAHLLDAEIYVTSSEFDALNRPLKSTAPDRSETSYTYNEANFLETVSLTSPNGNVKSIVTKIEYDAKGQRTEIKYGNGVTTKYTYNKNTFRLTRLESFKGSKILQDLNYYYDPVGNITDMQDDAQDEIYYKNRVVQPHTSYEYDALYRLKIAEGREHIGQSTPIPHLGKKHFDFTHFHSIPNSNDNQAMRKYIRTYDYDQLGNIMTINHSPKIGTGGWTRTYEYKAASLLDNNVDGNRLTKTNLTNPNSAQIYTYDEHGNMTSMDSTTHLPNMNWDFADQLKSVKLDLNNNFEYYTYTIGGGKDFGVRTRKVTEKGGIIHDRIYLGDYEIYRKIIAGNKIEQQRSTLHIQDDKGRIAVVDTLTIDGQVFIQNPTPIIRYQLSNHLGSATMELDEVGDLISYEEYYPFGASSFQAGKSVAEVSLKRYRYVGKEKDEATGLYYYGARYYADWICRFVSVDDLKDEYPFYTPYQYAGNKPIIAIDIDGLEGKGFQGENGQDLNYTYSFPEDELNTEVDTYSKYNIQEPTPSLMHQSTVEKEIPESLEYSVFDVKGVKYGVIFEVEGGGKVTLTGKVVAGYEKIAEGYVGLRLTAEGTFKTSSAQILTGGNIRLSGVGGVKVLSLGIDGEVELAKKSFGDDNPDLETKLSGYYKNEPVKNKYILPRPYSTSDTLHESIGIKVKPKVSFSGDTTIAQLGVEVDAAWATKSPLGMLGPFPISLVVETKGHGTISLTAKVFELNPKQRTKKTFSDDFLDLQNNITEFNDAIDQGWVPFSSKQPPR